jgi:hypothetical protein
MDRSLTGAMRGSALGSASGYAGLSGLNNAAALCGTEQPERDQSPVQQSMSILFNAINEARAEAEHLANRLEPVRRPSSPQETHKGMECPPASCPLDAEVLEFSRRVLGLSDLLRQMQSDLRI